MEHVNKKFFDKIDPRNFSIAAKLISLVLVLLLFLAAFYSTLGLQSLRRSLLNTTGDYLEHIGYIKASELNLSFQDFENEATKLANSSEIRRASLDFITAFKSIDTEHDQLLYGGRKAEIKKELQSYYSNQVKSHSPLSADLIESYFPRDDRTLIAQHVFLAQNPKEYDERYKYTQADDPSTYATYHLKHHPELLNALNALKAYDLYLIDPNTGYVVYSTKKNIDFGVDLNKGLFKTSKLAEVMHQSMASEENDIHLSNYSPYLPASDKPLLFVSMPVYYNERFISVLVLSFETNIFDTRLVQDYMKVGNSSLQYAVVNENLQLYNNPKEYLLSPKNYEQKLLRKARRSEAGQVAKHLEMGNLAVITQYPFDFKDRIQNEGVTELRDFNNTPVLASTVKLTINGLPVYLVTQINRSEVNRQFLQQGSKHLAVVFIILASMFFLIRYLSRNFASRLMQLLESIQLLQRGEKAPLLQNTIRDELGSAIEAYNAMRQRIINAEEFALEMSDGNYNYNFEVLSEKDSLGKSLNVLKEKLIQSKAEHDQRAVEDKIRNWSNAGVAKFNDLLRSNNNNIKKLAYIIIENLVDYVGANVGGIYLVEGETESDKRIELLSAYAYDRRKYLTKSYATNEGLLGACCQEKKPIFLKKIPNDYIEIGSGLGSQIPTCLYLVPLLVDEEVLGIIEIASFDLLDNYKIELINQLADSIAGTFIGVRLNMRTASLLEESNRRAEEITQQEEEMRQNLEEMQATQEELARLRQDDERKSEEMQLRIENTRNTLKSLVEALPGGYTLKDANGVIHLINSEGAAYYESTIDRVIGKSDHELLPAKRYEAEHQHDMDTLENGTQEYEDEVEIGGNVSCYHVTKKPFLMAELGQNGILTIRIRH